MAETDSILPDSTVLRKKRKRRQTDEPRGLSSDTLAAQEAARDGGKRRARKEATTPSMGDAVVRVQKHLQELSRDNFTALETTHSRNIDWLRSELIALCKEIDVAIKLELKRPAPATYTSGYVFVAKKQKVATPTVSRTQQQEEVSAASQPALESIPSADPIESADANTNPQVVAVANAEPARAVETMKVKKFVTRIRKVMQPKRSNSVTNKRVKKEQRKVIDPESMKVVQLRAELKKRGLKAAGLKAVLVERLLEAIEEEDNSDDDDVVELEEVDEEYEEEIEEEVDVQSNNAAGASTTERSLQQKAAPATEESSSILDNDFHSSPPSKSKSAKSDEIVRESDCGIDDVSLFQKSAADENLLQPQASAKPKRTLQRGAGRKRPRNDVVSASVDLDDNGDTESTEGDDSLVAEDGDVEMTSASSEPSLESKQPCRGIQESSSAEPTAITTSHKANANTTDSITGETDTSDISVDLRGKQSAQPSEPELLEKKSSVKVSFAARKDDTIVPDSQPDQSLRASPSQSNSDDSVSRSRSISLPQPSVSTNAIPTTPNGQMITDELQVARSEPTLGGPNDTDEDRRQREHQQTIEREAQRLRIAAKLSAKKRFEEAKLSSAFWAKRDRLKSQLQVAPSSSFDASSAKSTQVAGISKPAEPQEKVAMKAEPELAVQATRQPSPQTAATEGISPAPEPLSTSSLVQQSTASSASTEVSLKSEPASQTRTKTVKIPFSSSNRRFSDPSRRLSASRRRESASSRRDSTSSRRDSVSSRRDSLSRRRDSSSSTISSVSAKSGAEIAKAPANGSRKPTNLVSGLHSFTTLMEKENTSTASSSTRSAPVVNALKLAEKTRLLEQKKNLEKMKRKEALMKKYEEQRKLDDDKKKKTMGLKEKTERDAKLKREQDKMNEKKQREIELAKKRHQKLQEMRAGLEKKRAMLAAEKQAGAAKLAAQAASSNRRISTSSLNSQASSKSAAPFQQAKSVAALQVLKATATSSQALNASAAPKTTKHVVPPQVQKPALTSVQAPSSQTASAPVKKEATTSKAKDRPTDASTYDMSDNGESESDGGDSEDEDKHNKKNIPRWARKENLERILRVQFGPNASDPSPAIFPDFVDTCDLEAIFQPTDVRKKKRFAKRSSSGNWFGDRPTAREKALYKRDMGYLG